MRALCVAVVVLAADPDPAGTDDRDSPVKELQKTEELLQSNAGGDKDLADAFQKVDAKMDALKHKIEADQQKYVAEDRSEGVDPAKFGAMDPVSLLETMASPDEHFKGFEAKLAKLEKTMKADARRFEQESLASKRKAEHLEQFPVKRAKASSLLEAPKDTAFQQAEQNLKKLQAKLDKEAAKLYGKKPSSLLETGGKVDENWTKIQDRLAELKQKIKDHEHMFNEKHGLSLAQTRAASRVSVEAEATHVQRRLKQLEAQIRDGAQHFIASIAPGKDSLAETSASGEAKAILNQMNNLADHTHRLASKSTRRMAQEARLDAMVAKVGQVYNAKRRTGWTPSALVQQKLNRAMADIAKANAKIRPDGESPAVYKLLQRYHQEDQQLVEQDDQLEDQEKAELKEEAQPDQAPTYGKLGPFGSIEDIESKLKGHYDETSLAELKDHIKLNDFRRKLVALHRAGSFADKTPAMREELESLLTGVRQWTENFKHDHPALAAHASSLLETSDSVGSDFAQLDAMRADLVKSQSDFREARKLMPFAEQDAMQHIHLRVTDAEAARDAEHD